MEVPVSRNKLCCIYYPGIVQNEEKMLQTLGGEGNISKVYADSQKRLELKWRPQDVHCKAACGNRQNVSNLLLRVRRRRKRRATANDSTAQSHVTQAAANQRAGTSHVTATGTSDSTVGTECSETDPAVPSGKPTTSADDPDYEYQASVIGIADTAYKFETLSDFQYLPMVRQERKRDNPAYKSLIPDIYIHEAVDNSKMVDKDVPLHLPPPIFSRIDTATEYCFREGPKHREGYHDPLSTQPSHLIGIARQRRPHYTRMFSSFMQSVPTEPMTEAVSLLETKVKDNSKVQQIKELFANRPIWSQNALKFQVVMPKEYFKYILPNVAYFCLTGPWRSLWVRLGYDPRTDVAAKKYQMVDFRNRLHKHIGTKRSIYSYHLPNTVVNKGQSHTALINKDTFREGYTVGDTANQKTVSVYIFDPGLLPPYRQMFYMVCDIHVPEVQELLHSNDGKETVCTERDGWCVTDFAEKVREILSEYVRKMVNSPTKDGVFTLPGKVGRTKKTPNQSASSTATTTQVTCQEAANQDAATAGESQDVSMDSDSEDLDPDLDLDLDLDAKVTGSDDDEEVNEMETELLEYMDPSQLLTE